MNTIHWTVALVLTLSVLCFSGCGPKTKSASDDHTDGHTADTADYTVSSDTGDDTGTTPITGGYYIDSNHPDASDQGPGTADQPWKSLAAINDRPFNPGDTIFLAADSAYMGTAVISSSGTDQAPITIRAYGEGAAPSLTTDDYEPHHGNVLHITGSHVTVQGLYFHTTPSAPDNESDVDILQVGAVFVATGADHVTIDNCEFEDTPIGINTLAQHTVITGNYLHDVSRFLSRPDWGPLGIVVGGTNVEIARNTCENIVAIGGNYGGDGGCIEIDDRYFGTDAHHISIHHNRSEGNMGFLEVERQVSGSDINVAYNLSDDHQEFIFFWGANNSRIENNTVIRTRPSLNGAVNTVFTMRGNDFVARNNIFVVANGVQVWVTAPYGFSEGYRSAVKENNLYFSLDDSADPSGVQLGPGELIGDPAFVDSNNGDYCLSPGSPGVDAAQSLGYTVDLSGLDVPAGAAPDMGAFECDL